MMEPMATRRPSAPSRRRRASEQVLRAFDTFFGEEEPGPTLRARFAAMAKRYSTDTGSKVVNDALQLFGGYGYLEDYPIERFWRALRVHSILEGTNQIMRMIVGRDMLRQ